MTILNGGGIVTLKIGIFYALIWDIGVNGKGLASIVPTLQELESCVGCLV